MRDNEAKNIRLMFVGDINLGEYYTSFGHGPKTFLKSRSPFSEVDHLLQQADFAVGNLEAPLTEANFDPREPESVVLRGSPSDAHFLSSANFRVLQLANNHAVQHGSAGFDETLRTLHKSNVEVIGLNSQDVLVIDIKGQRLGFLAASDVPDNANKLQESYQRLDETFKKRVENAVTQVDHLFVLLHWGLEASTKPMGYQDDFANELEAIGVRGLIGQHPHLFYGIKSSTNFVYAPSLGNFVFDLAWDDRLLKTGILDINISGGTLISKVWPVNITNNGCLPCLSGEPVSIGNSVTLYDLGTSMKGEQWRKISYFLRNIFLGDTMLKIKFFLRKILPSLDRKKLREI